MARRITVAFIGSSEYVNADLLPGETQRFERELALHNSAGACDDAEVVECNFVSNAGAEVSYTKDEEAECGEVVDRYGEPQVSNFMFQVRGTFSSRVNLVSVWVEFGWGGGEFLGVGLFWGFYAKYFFSDLSEYHP